MKVMLIRVIFLLKKKIRVIFGKK